MTDTKEIRKFEVDETYQTRSICDNNCIFSYKVIKRTPKMLVIESRGRQYRTKIHLSWNGEEEIIYPAGKYSMAPVLGANDVVEKEAEVINFPVKKEKLEYEKVNFGGNVMYLV